jgi:hypothetical protein
MSEWKVVREWEYKGYKLTVKFHDWGNPIMEAYKHFNGYVTADKVIPEEIAESELDVHGGITYYSEDRGGITYGFDCAHAGDNYLVQNEEYTAKECERLADAIYKFVIDELA